MDSQEPRLENVQMQNLPGFSIHLRPLRAHPLPFPRCPEDIFFRILGQEQVRLRATGSRHRDDDQNLYILHRPCS